MPAYRSPKEAEVRDAVVARLRAVRPGARIIHEINTAGTGSNRIDVLAVDRAEVIAVEIKSEKDKLDRLPDQVEAMRKVAHHVIAAIHEKHLVQKPEPWMRDDLVDIPRDMTKGAVKWIYPELQRPGLWDWRWEDPRPTVTKPLPEGAIWMLWSAELVQLCADLQVSVSKRPTIGHMVTALRWNATGAQITKGICAALRARACIEADPPCGSPPANDNTITQAKEATHG